MNGEAWQAHTFLVKLEQLCFDWHRYAERDGRGRLFVYIPIGGLDGFVQFLVSTNKATTSKKDITMKKLAFVTIHGMGKTDTNYADSLFRSVRTMLKERAAEVSFHKIYYDGDMQSREDAIFGDMMSFKKLRWTSFRETAMYGLADAVGVEARRDMPDNDYTKAQECIAKTLREAVKALRNAEKPVVVLAHSLGCQVLSNYIWDAQHQNHVDPSKYPKTGIWSNPSTSSVFDGLTADEIAFLRLETMQYLYTTGCNIPIFVAALAREKIESITRPNSNFQWHNYFDVDDPLGWPLNPLGGGYETIVADHDVNVGSLLNNWTPFSHNEYWSDDDVLTPLVNSISGLLSAR